MTRDYNDFSNKKFTIRVNKHNIDITRDIKLLHHILMIDFKSDYYKFESVYNNASMYVSNTQQGSHNILILFGSVYLDIKTRKFYSISIINGNVLLQNSSAIERPYYYDTT